MSIFAQTAQSAARQAGEYLMQHFGNQIASEDKESHHSIVTEHDVEAERLLIETIRAQFPNHSILSEEKGLDDRGDEYTWIIDPLDGSSYYARGINTFSVAVGLVKGNEIVCGAVYCPAQDEMFFAEAGGGAFLNGLQIRVSEVKEIKKSMLTVGHRYIRLDEYEKGARALLKSVRSIRGGGSCAQELCYLACGRTDILLTVNQSFWDYAAGTIILHEAGGIVTDINNAQADITKVMNDKFDLLATNRKLHRHVLDLIAEKDV